MIKMIALDEMNIGELAEIEDVLGKPMRQVREEITRHAAVPMRTLAAMILISARREDPTFTMEQALAMNLEGDDVLDWSGIDSRMGEVEVAEDGAPDPTESGGVTAPAAAAG